MVPSLLNKIGHNVSVRITKIRGTGEFYRRLLDAGFRCGSLVKIDGSSLTPSCLLIHLDGSTLPLSNDEAKRIYVEAV